MAEHSTIEWTDHTFNPWVGCTKISPACDHCYAEGWAKRTGQAHLWTGDRRRTSEAYWQGPHKWNARAEREGRRYRVFCASLADVLDKQVPRECRMARRPIRPDRSDDASGLAAADQTSAEHPQDAA